MFLLQSIWGSPKLFCSASAFLSAATNFSSGFQTGLAVCATSWSHSNWLLFFIELTGLFCLLLSIATRSAYRWTTLQQLFVKSKQPFCISKMYQYWMVLVSHLIKRVLTHENAFLFLSKEQDYANFVCGRSSLFLHHFFLSLSSAGN